MERLIGFSISGIHKIGSTKQLCFAMPTSSNVVSAFESTQNAAVIQAMLPRGGSVDTAIEPYRIAERYSNYIFRLSAADEVGAHLFRKAARAVGRLPGPVSSTASAVFLGIPALGTAPFDITEGGNFNVVYIGEETLFIPSGSETAPGSGSYTGVLRGRVGSVAVDHGTGTYIYRTPPFWQGRKLTLFDFALDRSQPFARRDTGRIADSFTQDNAEIVVRMSSHLAGINNQTINVRPFDMRGKADALRFAQRAAEGGRDEAFLAGAILRNAGEALTFNIAKRQLQDGTVRFSASGVDMDIGHVFVEYDNHLQYYVQRTPDVYAPDTPVKASILGSSVLPPAEGGAVPGLSPERLSVLFCVIHPSVDAYVDAAGTLVPFRAPTQAYKHLTINADIKDVYTYHPLAIAAGLMLSTQSARLNADRFDVFHPNYSLDASDAFSDDSIQDIHDLIRATPDSRVDYFVLGSKNAPVKVMAAIRNMLHVHGFRLSVDNEGFFKFSRTRTITAREFGVATATPLKALPSALLSFDDGNGDTTSIITGTYGQTPYRRGSAFSVTALDDDVLPKQAQQNFDQMTMTADTLQSLLRIRAVLESRALVQDFQGARLKIRVADHLIDGLDYSLGGFLALADLPIKKAWLWDKDGQRKKNLLSTTTPAWVGEVIGRRYLPQDNYYELELFFANDALTRDRAPSGVLRQTTPSGEPEIYLEDTHFGDVAGDLSRFTQGDQVMIYTPDGVYLAGPHTIMNIPDVDGYLEFSVGLTELARGSVVELAHIDTVSSGVGYDNPAVIAGVDRAYVFMGTANRTLGTAAGPADQYGG